MLTPDVSTFRGDPAPCAGRFHAAGALICIRLAPKEVAGHLCMSLRGTEATGATTLTPSRLRTPSVRLHNTFGLDREGLARAQQLAGLALGDTRRRDMAEQALLGCLTDPAQLARIRDATLCHGTAGILITTHHAARDAPPGTYATCLYHIRARHDRQPGLPAGGLLEGNTGRLLAALCDDTAGRTASGWDACILPT